MNKALIICFAILVLACLGFMCFNLYQINTTLSSLSTNVEKLNSSTSHIDSMVSAIRSKVVGTGFSLTPFN